MYKNKDISSVEFTLIKKTIAFINEKKNISKKTIF